MNDTTPAGFAALDLSAPVLRALEKIGYEQPTPIQSRSIPPLLAGRDLVGVAQTGTGKTAAFALPLLSRIDLAVNRPQVLVLAPTRELAIQVAEAFQRYAVEMKGFHVVPIYGGQDYERQLHRLRRGVHVVVGTPGRVMDHLRRGTLVLDALRTLVLDEADEMLQMGFLDDVEWILQHVPEVRQTALFSATMPAPIRKVAATYLREPSEIRIEAETATVGTTDQRACLVHGHDKLNALTRLLETEDFDGMLVFVRTKTATVELAERMEARGFACDALNGDMNQQARERTISRLRSGAIDVVIATDVAARGIDVARISHVVNVDIPHDAEAYIHRIGRTGRAGRAGAAITFVTPRENRLLRAIERATRSPIRWLAVPGRKQLAERRITAFKQQMQDILTGDEELAFFRDLIRDFAEENRCSIEDAAAALAFMLQRKRPLQPPPDEITPPRPPRPLVERRARPPRAEQSSLERYRIEVGREHGATPGNIVGAIANETGLDSGHIGRIELYGTHSTVELPRDMPAPVLQHLRKVRIYQQPLAIRRDDGQAGEAGEAGAAAGSVEPNRRPAAGRPFKGRKAVRSARAAGGGKPKRLGKGARKFAAKTAAAGTPKRGKKSGAGAAGRPPG